MPGKKIDLVIPFSAPALDLVVAHGDRLFPQTPVVFTAVLDEQLKSLNLKSNVTDVLVKVDFRRVTGYSTENPSEDLSRGD
ncbi:MAG: hypothetical protein KJP23_04805 [Deltaproteobacteria bacterium]|nr:hypothetical protein [Deltaproteobacteria bacterium]